MGILLGKRGRHEQGGDRTSQNGAFRKRRRTMGPKQAPLGG